MDSGDRSAEEKSPLKTNRSLWLIVSTLCLLSGQAWAAWRSFPPVCLLVFILPATFLVWGGKRQLAALTLLAGVAFFVGYRNHRSILFPVFPSNHLRSVAEEGEKLYLEGALRREPERFPGRSSWTLRGERIWHPTGAQEITGDVLITVRRQTREWRYGDRIRLWLEPRAPRSGGNPGSFDYAAFLARRQIYLTAFVETDASVELLSREAGVWSAVEALRRKMRRFIEGAFSEENGALMKALVVGDRGGIPRALRERFAAAGLAHLLAISGLHVGTLALVVFFLSRRLGSWSVALLLRWNLPKVATCLSCVAVLFYMLIAGASVPTVRAAIMVAVYALAVLADREDEVLNSLAIAALLIGLYWPGAIMEVSFQLSFLAVLFIVWGLRRVRAWLPARRRDELPQERSRVRRMLRPAGLYLVVPVLATIGTGPMIAHHFGYHSWAGFLANPIVVPLVGFVIVPLGLAIGFLSLISPALPLPFVWIAEPLLSLVREMVHFFSHLPLARVGVPLPNLTEVGLMYLLILSLLLWRRRLSSFLALAAVLVALAGDAVYWWRERWERKSLRVTYLDVGQGDAAVVEFPGSRVLLVDAGGTSSGEFDTGESIVAPFLRSRKILKVDYLLVTHPRVDHYGGMRAIAEAFSPAEFWAGPARGETARYRELERVLERAKIQKLVVSEADPCRAIEEVKACVLYPGNDGRGGSSVVLSLTVGQTNFLFAGDIESRDEKALLENGADLSSAVVKVPRHGSLGSSTEAFVAAVAPNLAIFSLGHRNRFGFPREEVLARYRKAGAEILRTDQDGAVTVETDGETIRYQTYRSGKKGEMEISKR